MNGGIVFRGSYIKAKEGDISVSGMSGSGLNQYGICATLDNVYTGSVSQVVSPFIGTNGAINLTGDSLALWAGNLVLVSGQDSSIAAPIIGIGRLFTSQYGLTKSGAGVLTLSGDASAWVAPTGTAESNKSGTFSNESSTVFNGVTKAQALYAFVQPVYLRLNTGLGSVYGSTPTFTYSLYDASSGGNAVTDALPSGTAFWTGGPTATSSVGSYSLTYSSGIALGMSSYRLNAGGAVSYTISPRPITITADVKTKVYGSNNPVLTYTVGAGRVGADTFTGSLSRIAGETVGTYSISAAALANANYTITPVSADLSITPKPITITADAKTKVYGSEDPVLTYTVGAGLVGADTFAGSLSRIAGENVGAYAISAAALANANYTITPVSADLGITPKPITITADAKTKVYGSNDPALTYTVGAGLVGADTFTGSLSRIAGENVGAYAISAAALTDANYTITPVGADLGITPKPITITADAKTKVYGSEDPALTYTVGAGLVGADTFTGSLSRTAGENVGAYAISAAALSNANYTITPFGADLGIMPKPITITADAKTKVYGSNDPALTYTVGAGLVGADTFTGSLSRIAGENVGAYAISAAALMNANYTITPFGADLSIMPKPITITADAKTKVYGSEDPSLTYTVGAGLVGADTFTGSLSRITGENVGAHAISASALSNANYTITPFGADLGIMPKPITITPDAKTKVYGSEDPLLTYTVGAGLVGSDTFAGSLSRIAGENVGVYAISAAALMNANYTITPLENAFTISQLPVIATAAVGSVYVAARTIPLPEVAQMDMKLEIIEVAPAAATQDNETAAPGFVSIDPAAAADRTRGSVLIQNGGIKKAPGLQRERFVE
jgi:hypothetical protein